MINATIVRHSATHTYTHTQKHTRAHWWNMTDYSGAGEGVTHHVASEPFGMICHYRKKHGGSAIIWLFCVILMAKHAGMKKRATTGCFLQGVIKNMQALSTQLFSSHFCHVLFCCLLLYLCTWHNSATPAPCSDDWLSVKHQVTYQAPCSIKPSNLFFSDRTQWLSDVGSWKWGVLSCMCQLASHISH